MARISLAKFTAYLEECSLPVNELLSEEVLLRLKPLMRVMPVFARASPPATRPVLPQSSFRRLAPNAGQPIVKKVSAEQIKRDIRIAINKASPMNIERQLKTIDDLILLYQQQTNASIPELCDVVFQSVSSNALHVNMYAKIFMHVAKTYPSIQTTLEYYTYDAWSSLPTIAYADASVDYDQFCKYNETNDERKSKLHFGLYLYKEKVLPESYLLSLAAFFEEKIAMHIHEVDAVPMVDQEVEMLGILLKELDVSLWSSEIQMTITMCANAKTKMYPSLDMRAIFKCRELFLKMNK